jgi:hypothetical protein
MQPVCTDAVVRVHSPVVLYPYSRTLVSVSIAPSRENQAVEKWFEPNNASLILRKLFVLPGPVTVLPTTSTTTVASPSTSSSDENVVKVVVFNASRIVQHLHRSMAIGTLHAAQPLLDADAAQQVLRSGVSTNNDAVIASIAVQPQDEAGRQRLAETLAKIALIEQALPAEYQPKRLGALLRKYIVIFTAP